MFCHRQRANLRPIPSLAVGVVTVPSGILCPGSIWVVCQASVICSSSRQTLYHFLGPFTEDQVQCPTANPGREGHKGKEYIEPDRDKVKDPKAYDPSPKYSLVELHPTFFRIKWLYADLFAKVMFKNDHCPNGSENKSVQSDKSQQFHGKGGEQPGKGCHGPGDDRYPKGRGFWNYGLKSHSGKLKILEMLRLTGFARYQKNQMGWNSFMKMGYSHLNQMNRFIVIIPDACRFPQIFLIQKTLNCLKQSPAESFWKMKTVHFTIQ